MSKDSGTTAPAVEVSVEPAPAGVDAAPAAAPQPGDRSLTIPPGAPLLTLLALGWLGGMLWSVRTTTTAPGGDAMAATAAAYALPGVISAGLVSGAAAGLLPVRLLSRRGVPGATPRFTAAVGAGLLVGLLAALAVSLGGAGGWATMVLAATTAAAATIGGIAAGVRTTAVTGAVVAGTLAVFAVGFALSLFQAPMLNLYGAGETQASQVTALNWFSRTASVGSGLAAGLAAFGYLRLARRRAAATDASPPRWPLYLLAGLGAGLLLLTAELLTRTAGSRVIALAGALSEADRVAQNLLGTARITHALVVLFVGGLTALIALGRTLRPAGDGEPATTAED